MKKAIKSFVMLLFIFMICGCDVKYNINIKQDLSIEDYIKIDFPTVLSSKYFLEPNEFIDQLYSSKMEEFSISGYTLNKEIGDDFSSVELSSVKNSLDNYLNNSPLKMLYGNINVTRKENDIVVRLTKMDDVFDNSYDENFVIDDFNIVFTSDYMIKDANCDDKNLITGEYIWKYKRGTLGKTIEFTLTDNKNYSAIVFGKIGYLILPIILLVILLICYIIYSNFKKKVMIVNEI